MKKAVHTLLSTLFFIVTLFAISSISVHAEEQYLYGFVYSIYTNDNGTAETNIADSNANYEYFNFAEEVTVNGNTIKNEISSLRDAIPTEVFIKYQLNQSNKIVSVNYDNAPETYTDVTYNSTTRSFNIEDLNTSGLPVYYVYYDPDHWITYISKPCPDENHTYDIEVYDYGIKVVDYTATSKSNTIKWVRMGERIESDFTLSMVITYSATAYDPYQGIQPLKVSVYDSQNKLVSDEPLYPSSQDNELKIKGLPNKAETYTIKLTSADASSPTYTFTHTTECITVLEGEITNTEIVFRNDNNNEYDDEISVDFLNSTGETLNFKTSYLTINGNETTPVQYSLSQIQKLIPINTPLKIAVIDGYIYILSFGTHISRFDYLLTADSNWNITNISVRAAISNISDTPKETDIYIATYYTYYTYDEDNDNFIPVTKLVNIFPATVTLNGDSTAIEVDLKNINPNTYFNKTFNEAKLFVWDETLTPLCSVKNANMYSSSGLPSTPYFPVKPSQSN